MRHVSWPLTAVVLVAVACARRSGGPSEAAVRFQALDRGVPRRESVSLRVTPPPPDRLSLAVHTWRGMSDIVRLPPGRYRAELTGVECAENAYWVAPPLPAWDFEAVAGRTSVVVIELGLDTVRVRPEHSDSTGAACRSWAR